MLPWNGIRFIQSILLPRENCWQGCTAMIADGLFFCLLQKMAVDQNTHTWGTNLARIRDLITRCVFPLDSVMCSESEKTRQRTGNGTKFKMSAEEDTELRDMVAQTLESKGVLGKIRVWKCTISIKCYVISKLWQSEYIFNSICHAVLFRTYGANIPLQLTMTNFCL